MAVWCSHGHDGRDKLTLLQTVQAAAYDFIVWCSFGHKSLYRELESHINHCHLLLLLRMKAGTCLTVQQRVEGWVDVSCWLHTKTVYLCALCSITELTWCNIKQLHWLMPACFHQGSEKPVFFKKKPNPGGFFRTHSASGCLSKHGNGKWCTEDLLLIS